ncbi:hypothetical protein [Spiroplasma endosymbiont of Villa modesta]|uniref:hypothetical protein n=1 Tax=Spiroplasma endosymbiont of Villa modesta TaxID=3066293 RepID=UPI00313B2795
MSKEYAYIIDTIVTQSLHQGEERHTFYSDNPFTYKGDYNEISVAQFRYNNMGLFTSNMFNWLTLYKLNHDEYEESEENTFSYPAKILPPEPMNVVKPIIIIPKNPTYSADLSLEDLFIVNDGKLKYSSYNWDNHVLPKIKPLEINLDIEERLDPTFLIKNFEDLQRYYDSIEVYLSWEYNTEEIKKGNHVSLHAFILDSSEEFSNKIENFVFKTKLNQLIYYNDNKKIIKKNENQIIDIIGGNQAYTGLATIGIKVNNENNLYNLYNKVVGKESIKINGKRERYVEPTGGIITELNINDNSYMYLGFKNLNNSRLNFNLEFFPFYLCLDLQAYNFPNNTKKQTIRAITKKYSLTISKIVINPR